MGRGLDVLAAIAARTRAGDGPCTVHDVASALDRDRSQVSRALKSLERQGLLTKDVSRRAFQLHWQVYADAQAITNRRLRTDGLTALERLAADTNLGCYLGILSAGSTVTIAESVPPSSRIVGSWIGRRYPAYCSDAGQALMWDADDHEVRAVFAGTEFTPRGPNTPRSVDDFLGRLNAARERGYSIIDEEAEPGLFSIAAPVRDFRGEVVAALQVVAPKVRLQPRVAQCAPALIEGARRLEDMIGAPTS